MWQFFSHIWWFSYFFLIYDGSILTLCSSNITCDHFFLTFGGFLIFFLTFDGFILTLCGSNITYNSSFVTYSDSFIFIFFKFDGSIVILSSINIASALFLSHWMVSLFFFSHLTVLSSHCTVLTSHVIVLFSHLVVPLLFSHVMQFQHYIW